MNPSSLKIAFPILTQERIFCGDLEPSNAKCRQARPRTFECKMHSNHEKEAALKRRLRPTGARDGPRRPVDATTAGRPSRQARPRTFECKVHSNNEKEAVPKGDDFFLITRARDGTRTRGLDLGKVALHQLSHSRICRLINDKCYTNELAHSGQVQILKWERKWKQSNENALDQVLWTGHSRLTLYMNSYCCAVYSANPLLFNSA